MGGWRATVAKSITKLSNTTHYQNTIAGCVGPKGADVDCYFKYVTTHSSSGLHPLNDRSLRTKKEENEEGERRRRTKKDNEEGKGERRQKKNEEGQRDQVATVAQLQRIVPGADPDSVAPSSSKIRMKFVAHTQRRKINVTHILSKEKQFVAHCKEGKQNENNVVSARSSVQRHQVANYITHRYS